MNGQIPADASDAPLSHKPDGLRTSAEYLFVAGAKQWNEKVLPWILDSLGPFEEDALVGRILEEIARPCPLRYSFCILRQAPLKVRIVLLHF